VIIVDPKGKDPDDLGMAVIELGASDVQVADGQLEIETAPEDFERVREGVIALGGKVVSAEVTMSPSTTIPVTGEREAEKLLALIDALEEQDDVQHVYANFDIPSEQLERIGQAV